MQHSSKKQRILIVEDEEAILNGLMDVLVFNGYSVESAQDGKIGLDMATQHPYDLIILDVMPVSYTHLTLPTILLV